MPTVPIRVVRQFEARAACGEASPWTSLRGLRGTGAEEGDSKTARSNAVGEFRAIQVIRGVGEKTSSITTSLPIGPGILDLATKESLRLASRSGCGTGGSGRSVGNEEVEMGVPFRSVHLTL